MKNSFFTLRLKFIRPMAAAAFMASLMMACSSSENGQEAPDNEPESGGSGFLAEGASEDEAMIKEGKGVGPVKSLTLAEMDPAMADAGKEIFEAKCTACHKFSDEKYVGPGLKGVTKRRKVEWIMNMMINPEEMTRLDPTAQELFVTHNMTQMTNQNIDEDGARKIFEYFRQMDAQ